MISEQEKYIRAIIEQCKGELNIDKKIEMLYRINGMLPDGRGLAIPSLITNDYLNLALYKIEEKLYLAP